MREFFFAGGTRQGGRLFPRLQHIPRIFDAAERAQAPWEARGEEIPTIATPRIILVPRNVPQVPWEARGEGIPTIATSGMPVCNPESCRSPIPAIYPYWEYPVDPVAGPSPPHKTIKHPGEKIEPLGD